MAIKKIKLREIRGHGNFEITYCLVLKLSEVLYQVFLSHHQIKCLYHGVIFDDKILIGPCSIKVSKSHPSSTRYYMY